MSACEFEAEGWTVMKTAIMPELLAALRETVFRPGEAGTRCLLDRPEVATAARVMRGHLVKEDLLSLDAVAVQAIAFDKTVEANWKVTWHQDVMFPFAERVRTAGYELPSKKDDTNYARPPRSVLEQMLTVRLHLDDCDETNGPLRVAPGSHRRGILKSTDIAAAVSQHGEVTCLARDGEALVMRPLLLHASSPAEVPKHRRVLHVVYYSGDPIAERWHRSLR
jgi:ectoine hydroxylase-related dioxygenase (phytanoyl-CoA dioxygenase family)